MKKYILSLVLVLALFVSFGKVFAQDLPIPDRTSIQNAYLEKKYGTATYTTIPRFDPRTVYIFGGDARINNDSWLDDQKAIDVEYKKEITDFQIYLSSLKTENTQNTQELVSLKYENTELKNQMEDKSSTSDQNISGALLKISAIQDENDSLTVKVKDLEAQLADAKKVSKAPVKTPATIKIQETAPVVSSVPVQDVVVPAVETPISKGFWATIWGWFK